MHILGKPSSTTLPALVAALLFNGAAGAQISGLCNTGQTVKTAAGCTGELVAPNPTGGGPNRDGNWKLAYPYPIGLPNAHAPCVLRTFVSAWVDTPPESWLPESVSTASEWVTPHDGEGNQPQGYYVYAISFPVPSVLPGGGVPTGLSVNGQLAADNLVYGIYLESPAFSDHCELVSNQQFPVGNLSNWSPFSFESAFELTPGKNALLLFVVENAPSNGYPNATGFRVEFSPSSAFF